MSDSPEWWHEGPDPAASERRQRGGRKGEREGEREGETGPPASCPGFVYNKKLLFDVVAQPAPKLTLPQDVLWVKCQTEATAGCVRPRHTGTRSPPEASGDLGEVHKTTAVWCIFVFVSFMGGEMCEEEFCRSTKQVRAASNEGKGTRCETLKFCRSFDSSSLFLFFFLT